MRKPGLLLLFSAVLLIQSCGSNNPNMGKPIVLGDSATIVTEEDPERLKDFVADVKMSQPMPHNTEEAPAPDTAAKIAQAQKEAVPQHEDEKPQPPKAEPKAPAAPAGNGLNMAFKEVSLLIPGVTVRAYKQQDLSKANGASYELASGAINGNHIKTGGSNVTKVSQRYQTVIAIKNEMGTLYLESLNRTTDWQALKGKSNDFMISGLDDRHMEFIKATPAAIKNAVSRTARNRRMNKATEQKWLNSIKHICAANQKPLTVILRSVMWKVEGKDAAGKPYQKQIRLDIPLK